MKELTLNTFPKVSKEDWIDLAKKQLKGADPIQELSWSSDEELSLDPYYAQSDIENLNDQIEFFNSIKPFAWKLYEQITVNNEKDANRSAIEALTGGCDGVVFVASSKIDFDELLKDILPDICDVSLHTTLELEKIPTGLSGYIISASKSTAAQYKATESQIDFISTILSQMTTEQHILRTSSSDFFLEVAAIRALRFLLTDYLGKDPNEIQIHTTVPLHGDENYQWFLNSTAGLASILGGTTSINFSTAKGASRTSRNVGNIIREECGISEYSDQCGGAYYLEVLTHKIIEASRSKLMSIKNG